MAGPRAQIIDDELDAWRNATAYRKDWKQGKKPIELLDCITINAALNNPAAVQADVVVVDLKNEEKLDDGHPPGWTVMGSIHEINPGTTFIICSKLINGRGEPINIRASSTVAHATRSKLHRNLLSKLEPRGTGPRSIREDMSQQLRQNENLWPELRAEIERARAVSGFAYDRVHVLPYRLARNVTGRSSFPQIHDIVEYYKQLREGPSPILNISIGQSLKGSSLLFRRGGNMFESIHRQSKLLYRLLLSFPLGEIQRSPIEEFYQIDMDIPEGEHEIKAGSKVGMHTLYAAEFTHFLTKVIDPQRQTPALTIKPDSKKTNGEADVGKLECYRPIRFTFHVPPQKLEFWPVADALHPIVEAANI
jgi:hypothetical protein